ncbi:MAG: flagellar export protein FliJ [Nitrospirae bacterium]|nr:flagellar export protein FliJ [Nitrospirota bacterium]
MSTIESLLNLKRWSEDEAKNLFALRLKELAVEEKRLADMEEQYRDIDCRFEAASSELIDVDEIKKLNEYLGHLLVRIRRQREVIILKETLVEEARKMLQEASKEKKTFEKLDEKQKRHLREAAMKKEQIGTDEHAGVRHARKTGERQ